MRHHVFGLSAYAAEGMEMSVRLQIGILSSFPFQNLSAFWLLRAEYPVQFVHRPHTELPRLDICCGPRYQIHPAPLLLER
ncbi:hypothetical protein VTN00DRAFT_840 [Thermoascus crustaceus]|uniref:uncharacterized protein n=1 Tax=Thermoascus crustaceus TaxID=5088 RepID=UPI00374249AA